ncbi:hypothetical protein KKC91_04625 [bacterium]|nr:hypothetical protein [bacterium]
MVPDNLAKLIEDRLGWKRLDKPLRFINKYKWLPKYIFSNSKDKIYIAVDVIFNQQFSRKIYQNEAIRALKDHSNLRICLFSSLDSEYENLKLFCKKNGFGLKIYSKESINTVHPFKSEKIEQIIRKKIKKEGWFPQIILNELKQIKKIRFKDQIKTLAKDLEKTHKKERQLSIVRNSINKMLRTHPSYLGNDIPFMRLSNFENLLNFSDVKCKDHVFHSARVFLIGCIIIDKFYKKFSDYYQKILGTSKINVEYIWLLASLFHDIGRIKRDAYRIYLSDPDKDNPALKEKIEEELSKDWQREEYKNSLGNIVELIKQSCKKNKDRDKPFIGFALGEVDENIAPILRESYNKLKSHGVVGCFELSSDFLRKKKASNFKNKAFFLYHIFPAALAIALHDHRIWKELADVKIFPIDMKNFPLAALLIYIDTWDDYKREDEQKVTIDNIVFQNNEVIVYLTWHKTNEYLDERLKYDSFERNVLFSDLKLKIKVSNRK